MVVPTQTTGGERADMATGSVKNLRSTLISLDNVNSELEEYVVSTAVKYKCVPEMEHIFQQLKKPSCAKPSATAISAPASVGDYSGAASPAEEVMLLLPRGKRSISVTKDRVCFKGKAESFEVMCADISFVLHLPLPEAKQNQVFVVVVLKEGKSITVGKSTLNMVVAQFKVSDKMTIDGGAACEGWQSEWRSAQSASEMLMRLVSGFPGTTIPVLSPLKQLPGGKGALKTIVKANEVWLFPLERGLFAMPGKFTSFIAHSFIEAVQKSGGVKDSFNIAVATKDGKVHEFEMIDNTNEPAFFNYVRQYGLGPAKKEKGKSKEAKDEDDEDESSYDEEDENSEDGDDSEDEDDINDDGSWMDSDGEEYNPGKDHDEDDDDSDDEDGEEGERTGEVAEIVAEDDPVEEEHAGTDDEGNERAKRRKRRRKE